MKSHVFTKYCISFEDILKETTLDRMLRVAEKQSKTSEAKLRADFANYSRYTDNDSCPMYFGMFVEWLAWHFLNHYGHEWSIEGVEMTASVDSTLSDNGIDGEGRTIKEIKERQFTQTCRVPQKGSPVYIQVKGSMNSIREYEPNDGSRLPNFMTNALSNAIRMQKAYQARYILFTTGKGLDYKMESMSNGMMEVINHKMIKRRMDNDCVFINRLRESVGLDKIDITSSKPDAEAATIMEIHKTFLEQEKVVDTQ